MGAGRAGVRRDHDPTTLGALALLAFAAPAASAQDAEIFATNNTAVITDPADPRLQDRLKGFANQVERIIDEGGGKARGSELLDGVFAGDAGLTFERSRVFDVDRVSEDELHTIADTIRARFGQQSVLTFDHLPAHSDDVDAVVAGRAGRQRLRPAHRAGQRRRGARPAVRRLGHAGPAPAARRLLGDGEFARAFAQQAGRRHEAREDALRQARVRRRAAAGAGRARDACRQRHRRRRRDRARRARGPGRGQARRGDVRVRRAQGRPRARRRRRGDRHLHGRGASGSS